MSVKGKIFYLYASLFLILRLGSQKSDAKFF